MEFAQGEDGDNPSFVCSQDVAQLSRELCAPAEMLCPS